MFAEYFARNGDLLVWPIVALAIFFTVFVVVLARVGLGLWRGTRLDDVASLPLESDAPGEPAGRAGEGR